MYCFFNKFFFKVEIFGNLPIFCHAHLVAIQDFVDREILFDRCGKCPMLCLFFDFKWTISAVKSTAHVMPCFMRQHSAFLCGGLAFADNLAEWADAAWVGSVGPFWPESVTWKWKVPDGVSVADLRDSERDLLEENRVNFMTAEYKHEYMKNGICGDGNFIDNVLGADYITHQIRENLYEIFIANKKIAYTDDGFALVAAGVFAALNRAVELHIIATDPEDDTGVYTVVIPKRADATDEQARNRQMPDIKWSAQLEGAVHSVKVNGTLRVTLNG